MTSGVAEHDVRHFPPRRRLQVAEDQGLAGLARLWALNFGSWNHPSGPAVAACAR
jgi:hypothetical protein